MSTNEGADDRRRRVSLQIGSEVKSMHQLTKEQQGRFSIAWLEQQVAEYHQLSRRKLVKEQP